ncbi:MAG TPA: polysaccharide deacetylase family protein, partial [Chitinophagaceae bacterium]|nr:polysaccharide deacetylase family protein [Chitinophagaceae bacterium]
HADRCDFEGHTLGNHSDQHGFWFDLLPARSMLREIKKVNQRIQQLLEPDFTVQYIRPPYGVTNPSLSRAIQKCGMISVGWNLRSYDTITRDPEELLHTLKSETKPGSLVLLHDRCESTVQVLTNYIHFCKEQGYTFTTL